MASRDSTVVGVDLGGTKILACRLDRAGRVLDRHEHPTPTGSQQELLAGLEAAIAELVEGAAGVGIGIPARLDRDTRYAVEAINIPLADVDLAGAMHDRFALPVGIENDANAAAYAEWALGAGRGASDMIMLTLGTGVGGGVVSGGRLFRGWAELGHTIVEFDGEPCQGACRGRGHLESYCSGTAATEAARAAFGPEADAEELLERAEAGDDQALAILDDIGRRLGAAIGSLANVFDPDLVVVGGGFGIAVGELVLGPARAVAERDGLARGRGEHARIVPAALGPDAGVVGAGLIAYEAIEAG
jgi:glucokinase